GEHWMAPCCHLDNKASFAIVNVITTIGKVLAVMRRYGLMARQRRRFGPSASGEAFGPSASGEADPRESRRGLKYRRVRRRRAPETARQEILDAAERVFARLHPDEAGLKVVGREAGVSHALITHYF